MDISQWETSQDRMMRKIRTSCNELLKDLKDRLMQIRKSQVDVWKPLGLCLFVLLFESALGSFTSN